MICGVFYMPYIDHSVDLDFCKRFASREGGGYRLHLQADADGAIQTHVHCRLLHLVGKELSIVIVCWTRRADEMGQSWPPKQQKYIDYVKHRF